MRRFTILKKTLLALMLLLSVGDASAFSFKTFFNAKFIALKRFFALKKGKERNPQPTTISQQLPKTQEKKSNDRPIITVWIHGTSTNVLRFIKKDGPKGLLKMEAVEESVKSKRVATALIEHDAQKFPEKSFYLYRWSGKLSFREREAQGHKLYQELSDEIKQYREKYGVEPYVRIITHSHGGNVALNLARAHTGNGPCKVDELILLACPVQATTSHLVTSPLFKKVYVLYSASDVVQVAAPQGIGFSSRRFPVTPNVVQAKVKINGKSPSHFDFVTPGFMRHLAGILTHLEHQKYAGARLKINSHQSI